MSSPDAVNPYRPKPDSYGGVRFESPLQLRQSLNWEAKRLTGLSAAKLWKEIKTGKYASTPLKDQFEGVLWLLDSVSLPSNRQQLLNPDLAR